MMTQLLTNIHNPHLGRRHSRFSLSVRLVSLLLVGLFCLSVASPTLVLAQDEEEEDLGYDDMGNPIESAATKDPPKYVLPYVAFSACLVIGIFAVCMSSKRKYAFTTGEYRTTNLIDMKEEHGEDDKKTVRARGGKGRKKLKK